MRPRVLAAAALLSLAPFALPSRAQTRSQLAAATETAPGPRHPPVTSTLPYAGTAADPLTLDVYKLSGPAPHPAVIILHGGGFLHGTSRNGSEAYAADFLAPAGFAVFSINYRLASTAAPAATFQDMLADVQRAVRFVRHNATQFQVDPNKIALLGGSAGGYLSNLAGVTRPSALTTSADPVDRETDAVEAVVTLYGISDLATMPDPAFAARLHLLAPGQTLAAASPISLVRSYDPPFLLIYGDKDTSVPAAQSARFQAVLEDAGVQADLLRIPGGTHGTGSWHTLPGVPDWEKQTITWLNQILGHTGPNSGAGVAPRSATPPAP